jgi:polar amino acid transport system permease protein
MTYVFEFSVITNNLGAFAGGAGRTLAFSMLAMVFGLVIGIGGAYAKTEMDGFLVRIVDVYVEIIRGTPFLIQLFFLYFGLPTLGLRLSPNSAAVLALTINLGAYAIEIVRAGLESVPRGQVEAASSLALTRRQIFTHVILMPALERVYPALTSQFVFLMLASSVVSVISAQELTMVAAFLESRTYRAFEIYFFTTIVYIALGFLLRGIFILIGKAIFSGRLGYQAGRA